LTIWLTFKDLQKTFKNKNVVIVGSAPSGIENNTAANIESFDEIIRVNNYKTKGIDLRNIPYDYSASLGMRTDWHYSFYGGSIRKTKEEMQAENIKGHLCKCPNAECHVTDWHRERNQQQGGDFRPIYRRRRDYWIAPVYVPERDHYMELFNLLGKHVPSTGFACIWELIQCEPKKLYITGFDFMRSKKHNVDELWNPGNQDDPIRHMWDSEAELLKKWAYKSKFIRLDKHLRKMFYGVKHV
jgi:hypothetical protein